MLIFFLNRQGLSNTFPSHFHIFIPFPSRYFQPANALPRAAKGRKRPRHLPALYLGGVLLSALFRSLGKRLVRLIM
jgi:hypothetical protein